MPTNQSVQKLWAALSAVSGWILYLSGAILTLIFSLGSFLIRLIAVVVVFLVIVFSVFATKRDVAYRYSDLDSDACKAQWSHVTALADVDNDEAAKSLNADVKSKNALSCMLQHHALRPTTNDVRSNINNPADVEACPVPEQEYIDGNPSLSYYLAFLEFQENGEPVQYGENHHLVTPQLKTLTGFLNCQKKKGNRNFVFVFVHGWRNDARIGNANVANVRLMAAYLASFLQQRCVLKQRYCKAAVTAVYIGWRGARLNEDHLPSQLSDVLAGMTLFDRKPVSERIAPAVISALHKIDTTIQSDSAAANASDDWYDKPHLITVGHSLGGNILAFGLKQAMIGLIEKNAELIKENHELSLLSQPASERPLLRSPIGDLVVLLNPASEAENWIALQRVFQFETNDDVKTPNVQDAYSNHQRPIYISLTAAKAWPANDVRLSDVVGIKKFVAQQIEQSTVSGQRYATIRRQHDPSGSNDCTSIRMLDSEYRPYYDYDTATYDLFPFYKWDFRPLAETIDEYANPDPYLCDAATYPEGLPKSLGKPRVPGVSRLLHLLADAFRNFPFMNTDITQTRTIGHLDPVRSPFGGVFGGESDPATWVGTTHELLINFRSKEPSSEDIYKAIAANYRGAASPDSQCDTVDGWLTAARRMRGIKNEYGRFVNWDSDGDSPSPALTPIRPSPDKYVNISGQMRQTLFFSGMRSITGANDPFWNVRAFQSAMTEHGGYVSYPLMCTIFQFVMDDITADTPSSSP